MTLEKQIALLKQACRFYMFRDDSLSQRKYAECCNRLASLYRQQEVAQC